MKKRFIGVGIRLFLICFLFVAGIVTTISQVAYRYIQHQIISNNEYYVTHLMSKVDQYLTLSFSSLQSLLYAIDSSYSPDPTKLALTMRQLLDLNQGTVSNMYRINQDLSMLGGSILSFMFEEPREERRAIYQQALDDKLGFHTTLPYKSPSSGWTVTIAKYLQTSSPPAVIAIDVNLSYLENNLLKLTRDDLLNIAIIDNQGHVVAGSPMVGGTIDAESRYMDVGGMSSVLWAKTSESTIHYKDAEGNPYTFIKLPASRFDWSIIAINNESRLEEPLRKLELANLVFLLLGLVLSAGAASQVSRYIRKPLKQITNQMRRVRHGQLELEVRLNRADEFGELSHSFDLMLSQIRSLLKEQEMSNELKRQLEIQVLQSQINPHFLYNTLGSISNVVGLGQTEMVDPIIKSLIQLLEYGIADADRPVKLEEELNNVRAYIFIQNIRYKKNFELQTNIEPPLYEFPVFRMLLQPLVENSLFHGYSGGRLLGNIRIEAFREERQVVIQVVDEGAGMTQERLASLLLPKSDGTDERKRIGLLNIHQRLRLYYGTPCGLTVVSAVGVGTTVRATFPAHVIPGGEANANLSLFDR